MNTTAERIAELDLAALGAALDDHGYARMPRLLNADQCVALRDDFERDELYRSTIDMARYNFGRGRYRYFSNPLPPLIATLRGTLYPGLAEIANRWQLALGIDKHFPATHAEYLEYCCAAGQQRPTPLLLRYGPGDFNCLHQDVYGEELFPLQVAVLLSMPGKDFDGGEFVVTEQRPRMQSRVEVVPLCQGDAVVFPVAQRPQRGARGFYRVNMRHGVSRLHEGERTTLGIIFHDAT